MKGRFNMANIKIVPFVIVGTIVHLGLCVAAFMPRVNCGFNDACMLAMSTPAKIFEDIMSLPLGLLVILFHAGGGRATGLTFLYPVLNSLLAVLIIWFALVRPLVRRANKKSA